MEMTGSRQAFEVMRATWTDCVGKFEGKHRPLYWPHDATEGQ